MLFYFLLSYNLLFFAFLPFLDSPFSTTKIISFLILNTAWTLIFLIKKQKIYIEKYSFYSIFSLLVILFLNLLFSQNIPFNLLGETANYWSFFLILNLAFFFILSRSVFLNSKNSSLAQLTNIFLPITAILSLIGILQFFGLNFTSINDDAFLNRIYSTLGNPNTLAFFTIIASILSLQSTTNKYHKYLFPLFLATLFLTQSRASFIAFSLGTLTLGALSKNKTIKFSSIAIFLSSAIASFFILNFENLRSLFSRFHLWQGTLNYWLAHPLNFLFGSPISSLNDNIRPFLATTYYQYEPLLSYLNSPHNLLLSIIYYTGILGFIIFFYFSLKTLKNLKSQHLPLLITISIFYLLNNSFLETSILSILILTSLPLSSSLPKLQFSLRGKLFPTTLLISTLLINTLFISYIIQFETKLNRLNQNLFSPNIISYLEDLAKHTSFSPFTQDFLLIFTTSSPTPSTPPSPFPEIPINQLVSNKYIHQNFKYQLLQFSEKELQDHFTQVQKQNQFLPSNLMELYQHAKNLNSPTSLQLAQEIQQYFIEKYPNSVLPSSEQRYKDNLTVFRILDLAE